LLPAVNARQDFIEHLKKNNINAVFHYQALHLSEMGKKFGGRPGTLPVSEAASDCLVRLPFFFSMTEGEQARVISAVKSFKM
jgi:dTDP-4-amino-4,6-dideoxygalactose transaminase